MTTGYADLAKVIRSGPVLVDPVLTAGGAGGVGDRPQALSLRLTFKALKQDMGIGA